MQSRLRWLPVLCCGLLCACASLPQHEEPPALPIRGLHLSAPAKKDLPAALDFIRTVLPREGINTLIVEFNYRFDFQSRPEFSSKDKLNREDVAQIVQACREARVELIPQINCLGHQSWAGHTAELLARHPEFDETPGKYPGNTNIYCRSYCPLHPGVHEVLFDLIDELAQACRAKSFHVGMDEVFLLADPDCPRCRGKDPAVLFAGEVTRLRDHLASIGCRMWMWGDRFLDGKATGLGMWCASENGTFPAVDLVPKDIVICDWQYTTSPPTPELFAAKGFDVVACPFRKSGVALEQLGRIRAMRSGRDRRVAQRARGFLQTTWCDVGAFVKAYGELRPDSAPEKTAASESAHCFTVLARAGREPAPLPAVDRPAGTQPGWVSLFNGRDLAGWQVTGRPADVAKGFWRVADGAIMADSMGQKGHDYVWLLSEKEYGDFELELRFQAFRDSPGNSGVQLRSRYDHAAFFLDGPQVDIHPAGSWRTGMIWDETRGSSRWLWPPVKRGAWVDESMAASNRVWKFSDEGDGWNQLQLRAQGTRLRAVLNGVKVMEWDGAGVLDDEVHRQRNVGLRGHLALQIHRNDQLRIRFKDLRLRELGREEP